jgi:hypothetical protein
MRAQLFDLFLAADKQRTGEAQRIDRDIIDFFLAARHDQQPVTRQQQVVRRHRLGAEGHLQGRACTIKSCMELLAGIS